MKVSNHKEKIFIRKNIILSLRKKGLAFDAPTYRKKDRKFKIELFLDEKEETEFGFSFSPQLKNCRLTLHFFPTKLILKENVKKDDGSTSEQKLLIIKKYKDKIDQISDLIEPFYKKYMWSKNDLQLLAGKRKDYSKIMKIFSVFESENIPLRQAFIDGNDFVLCFGSSVISYRICKPENNFKYYIKIFIYGQGTNKYQTYRSWIVNEKIRNIVWKFYSFDDSNTDQIVSQDYEFEKYINLYKILNQ